MYIFTTLANKMTGDIYHHCIMMILCHNLTGDIGLCKTSALLKTQTSKCHAFMLFKNILKRFMILLYNKKPIV